MMPADPAPVELTLAAVGDLAVHRKLLQSGSRQGWDWMLADAAPELGAADLAVASLVGPVVETRLASSGRGADGWPEALLPELGMAGLDVVSLASEHTFDLGPAGVLDTWNRVAASGLGAAGAGPTLVWARSPWVAEVNGVRVAFLAATDLTEVEPPADPAGPSLFLTGSRHCAGSCSGIDRRANHHLLDEERLLGAIATADALAEVVVLSLHWGDEDRSLPLADYPPLARRLVEAGVDVVLGHHPQVLQPVERIARADGTHGVIAYSLGNLISSRQNARARDGVILKLGLTWTADGRVDVGEPSIVPLWTDHADGLLRVRTHRSLLDQAEAEADPALRRLVERRRDAIHAQIAP